MFHKKPAIGIDVADTMACVKEAALASINNRFHTDIRINHLSSFNIEEHPISQRSGITAEHVRDVLKELWRENSTISIIDPSIPEIIRRLRRDYHVSITTANDAKSSQLEEWLDANGIRYDMLVHVDSTRAKVGQETAHVDVFVDDSETVAEMAMLVGKRVLLIEKPWNMRFASIYRGESKMSRIIPVKGWKDISNILEDANFIEELSKALR